MFSLLFYKNVSDAPENQGQQKIVDGELLLIQKRYTLLQSRVAPLFGVLGVLNESWSLNQMQMEHIQKITNAAQPEKATQSDDPPVS